MKGDANNLAKIERFDLWLRKGTGDFVFEHFGERPKEGADEWPDQPRVAEEFGVHARIDVPIEIDRAPISRAHGGGADFQVVGASNAIGNDEGAVAASGATAAEAWHEGIE